MPITTCPNINANGSILSKEFIEITNELKNFYINLKNKFNDYDQTIKNDKDILDFISVNSKEHLKKLKELYHAAWKILENQGLTKEEDRINPSFQIYKNYFQNNLHQFFLVSPFCKRVYEKPLGYAGDFLMMKYIYDNKLEGFNLFNKFIHYFSVNIEVAQAVRSRKDYISSKILSLANHSSFSLLNVACGPAVEITELINNKKLSNCKINLLDSEAKALQYVNEQINQDALIKMGINLNLYNYSISELIAKKGLIGPQDLIYCTGLFDYLSDKLSVKLINKLFLLLKNGGYLIIGNLKMSEKILRAYMDLLGEWFLHYRNDEELMSLAQGTIESSKISVEHDPLDIQLYLVIKKSK